MEWRTNIESAKCCCGDASAHPQFPRLTFCRFLSPVCLRKSAPASGDGFLRYDGRRRERRRENRRGSHLLSCCTSGRSREVHVPPVAVQIGWAVEVRPPTPRGVFRTPLLQSRHIASLWDARQRRVRIVRCTASDRLFSRAPLCARRTRVFLLRRHNPCRPCDAIPLRMRQTLTTAI